MTKIEKTALDINNLVGDAFESMTLEEMALTQGSGDVIPQSTPGCLVVASVVASSGWCGAGAATGSLLVLSIKRC